jgi:hypothetical protein
VPGDEINNHFEGKQIGDFECFVQEEDGKQFLIHCHKEDKYVCKVMSTHGRMEETVREALLPFVALVSSKQLWVLDRDEIGGAPWLMYCSTH